MSFNQLFTILVKREVTKGVDPIPTPSVNAILVKDLQVRPVAEIIERNMNNPSFSSFAAVVGAKMYEATFKTELKGSGTAQAGGAADVPEIDPLLAALGMARTDTAEDSSGEGDGMIEYDPASTGLETVTLYGYMDGLLMKMHYCVVNSFRLTAEAGKTGEIDISMIGLYTTPTDTATPAGLVYNATVPPPFNNALMKVDDYAHEFDKLSIDMGLTVAQRKDANAAQAIKGFEITDRSVVGSIDPAQITERAHPIFANWESGRVMPFTAQLGATPGNIIVITGPKVQYREITPGNREGIATFDIPLLFARQNGDDEIKFTFK